MKQNNEKTSKGVALTEAQWERCDRLANETGCRSRNAFIRDAIDFIVHGSKRSRANAS